MTGSTTKRISTAFAAGLLLAALPSIAGAATITSRVSHTATLLATGDLLVVGGLDNTETVLASVEKIASSRDSSIQTMTNIPTGRSSHTATLLTNGCVLVAGGSTGGTTATNTVEIYNPNNNTWLSPGNLTTARYDHTATLLNDGRVLVCGGQSGAAVVSTCEIYTPATCQTGAWAAGPSMLLGRYNHTAVLLKDGKVWFAGGSTSTAAGFTPTTERFNPAAPATMQSASPLIEARAHHSATLMGDGKVLVAGGYNRRDILANIGTLDTAEIYDPVANSVTPADTMNARRQNHAAVLSAEGVVTAFGGLGNVTTTYVGPTALNTTQLLFQPGSDVTSSYSGTLTTGTITGGTLLLDIDTLLGTPVRGQIQDGEIWLSSPAVKTAAGMVELRPAFPTDPAQGARIDLDGAFVGCRNPGPIENNCGNIQGLDVAITNVQGQIFYFPRVGVVAQGNPTVNAGSSFTMDGALTEGIGSRAITSGSLATVFTLGMPTELIGHDLIDGTVSIIGGGFTQSSSFSVVLDGGSVTFGTDIPVTADVFGNGEATFSLTFTGITGTMTWEGEAGSGYTIPTPRTVPVDGAGPPNVNLTVSLSYVADGLDLTDKIFDIDVATIVVRKMVFADRQYYNPDANEWTFNPPGGDSSVSLAEARFGQAATLLNNNDVIITGGRTCDNVFDAICSRTRATLAFPNYAFVTAEDNFTNPAGQSALRAFHTATLLPDGDILVAGGTNGPSILQSAQTYRPGPDTFTDTAQPMRYVRDLHTATLLPNGRVLIAGGFTTNSSSTGSTNTVEIYYPDTRLFLETTPMISSRSNHTAIMLPDGRVLVAGGFGPNDVITGTAEIFISTENRWIAAQTMPGGCERAIHSTVQLKDGRILLIGGINSSGILSSVAMYQPATNTWDCGSLAALPTPLRSHTSTLLFDGRVLVAGGNDGFGEANVAYIYDPNANTWTPTHATPLLEPRFNHTATLLPNGTVMLTGGSKRFGEVPSVHETFHVAASSFVTLGVNFFDGARAFHTMTLALNNRLYGIGGSDGVIGGSGVALFDTVESGYFTYTPDAYSKGAPPSLRQSTITATSATPFLESTNLTVVGNQFRGGTEASGGGSASAYSAFSYPHMILQQVDGSGGAASQSNGGFAIDLTTQIFVNGSNLATLNSSVTVALPTTRNEMPYGWYALRMGANDIFSEGKMVQAGPAKPTAAPANVLFFPQGVSSITWTWNQIAGVDGYNVYNATTGVHLSTIPQSATPTYFQTGLQAGGTTSILIAGYTLSGDGPLTASPTTYALSTTPAQVTIASVTFSDLLLYWSANGNAAPGTKYEVSQSTDDFVTSFSTPVPTVFNLTDTFTTISNLTGNTTYYFRVRAINLVGDASPFSASVSTRTRTSVSQPTIAGRTTTSISWTWSDPGGVTNYRVYNATSGALLAVVPGNITTFNDVGLSTNAIRSIRLTAVTGAGEGPVSPSATFYTMAATPVAFNPAIPPATLSTGSFQLVWTGNGNPLSTLYRAFFTEYDTDGVIIGTYGVTTTGFSASLGGLRPSSLFSYELVAINGDGVDSDTPATVVGSTWTRPAQPIPLTVLGTDPSTISIDWSPNNNSSSATYEVTYTTDNFVTNIATAIPFSLNFNGTNYVIPGLVTSTTYSIRVIARNPFGQLSAFSNIVTTRTFNGGAAQGAIAGVLREADDSAIFGTLGNGRVINLRAPAHTFSSDVTVTISSFLPAGTLCPGATNIAFSITNSPAIQPIGSLYLTFAFTPAELGTIPAKRALLLRYDQPSNTCVPLETTLDSANGFMTARINHFSLFQVGQVPAATNTGSARVFPNPYYTGRDGYATIDNVPAGARIRIFTLRGEQVLDQVANGAGLLTWSGTNGSGRAVASGVYIIMVESGGDKKIMKLALIR